VVGRERSLRPADAPAEPVPDEEIVLRSAEDTGTAAGEWFTLKPDAEMAGDQGGDDAQSLVFETAVLAAPLSLVGFPVLRVRLAPATAAGILAARLVDVHPGGEATRVSFGVLNLAHRNGSETPQPLVPGADVDVTLVLDACGYRFGVGHRVRLSLSTAYWPTVLPLPDAGALLLRPGTLVLDLPLLPAGAVEIEVPEPADPDVLPPSIVHQRGGSERRVTRDPLRGVTTVRKHEDTGLTERPGTGLSTRQVCEETWTIRPDDPLSLEGDARWTTEMQREGWAVRTLARATLTASATEWILLAEVTAFEGDAEVHRKTWARRIKRDAM
jgi:hypothetical protein